jgi:hypothetical protein
MFPLAGPIGRLPTILAFMWVLIASGDRKPPHARLPNSKVRPLDPHSARYSEDRGQHKQWDGNYRPHQTPPRPQRANQADRRSDGQPEQAIDNMKRPGLIISIESRLSGCHTHPDY